MAQDLAFWGLPSVWALQKWVFGCRFQGFGKKHGDGRRGLLGGSGYLLTNYNCTENHIRALRGLTSGLQVQL